jgi:preprotein translocase subunit SecG
MLAVLLVIHLIACLALTGAVLLQRSEGGALGMGGGGQGSFISSRGAADVLVRTTMVLGAIFFATSIGLSFVHSHTIDAPSDLERQLQERANDPFDPLNPTSTTPAAPATTETPAAPADPLAPVITPPAEGSIAPATPPATVPATPPATENGGSPQ